MNKSEQQTLALASIFQTTALVHQLASTGHCDTHSNKASLNSIVSQGTSIREIFRSPNDLKVGISSLKTVLAPKPINMKNIMLYTTALINLEKKLMKEPHLLDKISTEIEAIKKQEFFDIYHTNTIAKLA